ncbi:MAG: hypothetical protein WC554_15455, partial [Clostridia bacterium]
MKKTFLILTFFLMSSMFVIGQNTFSTGNMGKFFRVGNNFRYIPYYGLHYTMLCDSVFFITDNSSITSGNGFMWEKASIGSNFIKTKFSRSIIADSLFSSDSIRLFKYDYTTGNLFLGFLTGSINTNGQDNAFIGNYSGQYNKEGNYNVFVGGYAGNADTSGNRNTFIGYHAGLTFGKGNNNICIGFKSGAHCDTLDNKLFIGSIQQSNLNYDSTKLIIFGSQNTNTLFQRLYFNSNVNVKHSLSVGDSIKFTKNIKGNTDYYFLTKDTVTGLVYILPMDSIFSGEGLMWSDTTTKLSTWTMLDTTAKWKLHNPGSKFVLIKNNKGIMVDSLFSSDTNRIYYYDIGNNNLYFGYNSGLSNSEGGENTFIGTNTGKINTTGNSNVFVGGSVGDANTEGYDNTFIGYTSGGANTKGNNNTFIGKGAGLFDTTGNYNTFIGASSGRNIKNGDYNIFIGDSSGSYLTTGNGLFLINSFNQLNIAGDSVNSYMFGRQNRNSLTSKLTLNTNVQIKHSLTVNNDTVFVKNDTTPTNGLATKLWTDNKFFTIANAALKLNISDTASLVLSKPRASQIYSTIADRIAGDKWGLVAAGSGYINVLNSKKIIATTLYTADSLEILTLASDNIKIGTGPRRAGTGVNNVFIGDANTGDAHTTGQSNVVIGAYAGGSIQAVSYNAFYGSYSGAASTGSYNAYFGPMSGRYMTTESYRIIINNIVRSNKLGDTTLSPVYIYSSVNMGDQIFYHNGNVVYTPTNTGDVVAGTGITKAMLNATIIYNGSSAIDISANPQIVAGTNGQRIMIIGTSDTNTLT